VNAALNGLRDRSRPMTSSSHRVPHVVYALVTPPGDLSFHRTLQTADGNLPVLRNLVGELIGHLQLGENLEALVNDEGFCLGLPGNPVATRMCGYLEPWFAQEPLIGPVVFAASDGSKTVSLTTAERRVLLDAWGDVTTGRIDGNGHGSG
jgi:hypothetical protein